MKLQYKLNLSAIAMILVIALSIVIVGTMVINDIVYEQEAEIMTLQLGKVMDDIDAKYSSLEKSGLVGVQTYVKATQEKLIETFKEFKVGETGYISVVTTDKIQVYHPTLEAGTTADFEFVNQMIEAKDGVLSYTFNGASKFSVFKTFDKWNWVVMLLVSEDEMFAMRTFYLQTVAMIALVILLVSVILYYIYVKKSIGNPLAIISANAKDFSVGNFELAEENWEAIEKLNQRQDEVGETSRAFTQLSYYLKSKADIAQNIAEGNIAVDIEFASEDDILGKSMYNMKENLVSLMNETEQLINSVTEGELDRRGNMDAFTGSWAELVGGINKIIHAFVIPFNFTSSYIDRISRGDIPAKITEEYKGDFNQIKISLNLLIDALNILQEDLQSTIDGQKRGDFSAKCSPDKLMGVYSDLAGGINQSLEALINPLQETIEILKEYADGKLQKQMKELPGDQIELTKASENIRNNLKDLVVEVSGLVRSALSGDLKTRGDIKKFSGDYSAIIKGVNATLDAVINPLNMAADYVQKISAGNMPEKITKEYKGDYNEIKNNLNTLIDNLSTFISEMNLLNIEQSKGDIDHFMKEDFTGFYQEMATGVNSAVQMHVSNILKILDVMGSYSDGDFSAKLEKLPGKQVIANEKLDLLRDNLDKVVGETVKLINFVKDGKLTESIDTSSFHGDWAKLTGGINELLATFIVPFKMAATNIDKISKGDIPDIITDEYKGDFNEIKTM